MVLSEDIGMALWRIMVPRNCRALNLATCGINHSIAIGMTMWAATSDKIEKQIVRWLLLVAVMIVAIVVIGGITRLTESGLSITQWKPISGILPPMGDAAWQAEFAHYRAIDQYGAVHSGMDLSAFKGIFFWEYIHRLLGRLIGMVAALGWLWFALRRAIPVGYAWRMFAVPLLIGVQGLLGWLMVRSGLQPGMTEVAPGWLAAHLLTALFTLSYVVWTFLDLRDGRGLDMRDGRARLTGFAAVTGAALAIQLLYGALMAGMRAGHVATDWPLMQGRLFPAGVDWSQGILRDPYLVHFIHRWWAWLVVALLVIMARRLKARGARGPTVAIHSAFGVQILLGIATVMSGVALWLAALHQLVGALLVVATVWGAHHLGRKV